MTALPTPPRRPEPASLPGWLLAAWTVTGILLVLIAVWAIRRDRAAARADWLSRLSLAADDRLALAERELQTWRADVHRLGKHDAVRTMLGAHGPGETRGEAGRRRSPRARGRGAGRAGGRAVGGGPRRPRRRHDGGPNRRPRPGGRPGRRGAARAGSGAHPFGEPRRARRGGRRAGPRGERQAGRSRVPRRGRPARLRRVVRADRARSTSVSGSWSRRERSCSSSRRPNPETPPGHSGCPRRSANASPRRLCARRGPPVNFRTAGADA